MQKLAWRKGSRSSTDGVARDRTGAEAVEAQNFSVRKHLLEYDDVMNKQRENIYALRRQISRAKSVPGRGRPETIVGTRDYLMDLAEEILDSLVETYAARQADYEQWISTRSNWRSPPSSPSTPATSSSPTGRRRNPRRSVERILQSYTEKEQQVAARCSSASSDIMLQIVDSQWKDHLYSLDHLKEGIGLRGYGQRDPLIEYRRKASSCSRR